MAYIKIISIAIVVLFLLSSFNFKYESEDFKNNLEELDSEIIDNNNREIRDDKCSISYSSRGSPMGSGLIENNAHGGSWVDSFKDDSGIDWGMSDHVEARFGDVKINHSYYDSNTVAWWHFNEGTSNTIYDETHYDNDGAIYGASWSAGKFGTGLSFDGNNDYIDVPDSPSLSITGSITISTWMKFTNTPSSGKYYAIVKKRVYDSNSYHLVIVDSGKPRLRIDTGPSAGNYIDGNTAINDGNWHFVVATWDQSSLKIYLDGKNDAAPVSLTGSMSDTSDKLSIGYHNAHPTSFDYYNGLMDEIRISNIARSARDIKDIYENGTSTNIRSANLTSKSINLPNNMYWDSLIINKTQPENTSLNITILNASNNQPIPGSLKYIDDGEFDISYIDPIKYPSLKLKANFTGNRSSTPILHYWGVSWNTTYAWRDTLVGGLKGTSNNLTTGDGEIWQATSLTDWYKYSKNPILFDGPASSWDDDGAMKATVIFNGTGYMMWYSGQSGSTRSIGLATSSDGITWTKYSGNPVLTKGSGWEGEYVSVPSVLYDGTTFKMWYTGMGTNTDMQTGYATSTNGINWQKYAGNPVLPVGSSSSDWDHHYAKINSVYYDGLTYKAWYTGLTQFGSGNAPYQIGYATSTNGFSWAKHPTNPIISSPPKWYHGKSSMVVLLENDQYYGWHSFSDGTVRNVNFTTSNDGINWTDYPYNPIIPSGSSGSWDKNYIIYTDIIFKDKQYYMYYRGNDGSKSQIGLAKSKFNTNGNFISEPISLLDSDKHNLLIINKTEPAGTYINVSILDATTEMSITNFENIRGDIINISAISRIAHPSIKLKANINSSGFETPILYDWSIGPNSPPQILDISSAHTVNRTHSVKFLINLTDSEEPEQDLLIKIEYKAPSDMTWKSVYLSALNFNTDHWECTFTPPADAELGQYQFRFTCNDSFQKSYIYPNPYNIKVVNNDPIIWSISTNPSVSNVNRTTTMTLIIVASDIETSNNQLGFNIRYKSPKDMTWQNSYISNILYISGHWEADFTPIKNAILGWYVINISCNDSDSEVFDLINIQVKNNAPIIWDISTTPVGLSINRTNTMKIIINTSDVENSTNELIVDIKYKSPGDTNWQSYYISNKVYKNGFWEADFTTSKSAELGNYTFNITSIDGDSKQVFDMLTLRIINNAPVIKDISTNSVGASVNRTKTIKLIVNASDVETDTDKLEISIRYKSPYDSNWHTEYISNLVYFNGHWEADFTPIKTAQIGIYIFNVTCNDSDSVLVFSKINLHVKNNAPIIWDIRTSTGDTNVNRTETLKIIFDASDVEISEEDLVVDIKYRSPFDAVWKNNYILDIIYINGHWEANFSPPKSASVGLYIFNITCYDNDTEVFDNFNLQVINNDPIIWNIHTSEYQVKRTKSINIIIYASDIETSQSYLDIDIRYKSPHDLNWQSEQIPEIVYKTDHWEADFTPEKSFDTGIYVLNISCKDNETEVFDHINLKVLNNIPSQPEVTILPIDPTTNDDLIIVISETNDVETPTNDLKFWYRWYKNNFYMQEFDNSTTIPTLVTERDQSWRCLVFVFDGIDVGPPGEAKTIILNSPPVLVEQFDSYEIFEDIPVILEEKLSTIFFDADNDILSFTSTDEINIRVEITQQNGTIKLIPRENWFGTEFITFYANDSFSVAEKETVQITVKPTNDLPKITQIGNQIVLDRSSELDFIVMQNDWLNLTVQVEDIDDDGERGMIKFMLNITQKSDFYFRDHDNTLIFHPKNQDVGWHYINITVTDNNETPTQYISQHIKIHVLNTNDPPTVKIISPKNEQEILPSDKLTFTCSAEDIDLFIWNSAEKLTFLWYTNNSKVAELGSGQTLTNKSLPPGFYNITVEVKDSEGAKAFGYVHIIVKELPEKDNSKSKQTSSIFLWVGVIIVILIIIIIIILLFITVRKKKKRLESMGIPKGQVFQDESLASPRTRELLSPAAISPMTSQPITQLPPVHTSIQGPLYISAEERRFGIDSKLSPQQKIALLEERLVRGEIDQEIYLNLKAKFEIDAKPYTPPQQLPPVHNPSTYEQQSAKYPQYQSRLKEQ